MASVPRTHKKWRKLTLAPSPMESLGNYIGLTETRTGTVLPGEYGSTDTKV